MTLLRLTEAVIALGAGLWVSAMGVLAIVGGITLVVRREQHR